MLLPFCKICGMHHRLGGCPLYQEPPAKEPPPGGTGTVPPQAGEPSREGGVAGQPRRPHPISVAQPEAVGPISRCPLGSVGPAVRCKKTAMQVSPRSSLGSPKA